MNLNQKCSWRSAINAIEKINRNIITEIVKDKYAQKNGLSVKILFGFSTAAL
jgi:hypothetical protein